MRAFLLPDKLSLSCKKEEALLSASLLKPATSSRSRVPQRLPILKRVLLKEGKGPKVLLRCRQLYSSLKCIFRSALLYEDPSKTK